MKLSRQWYSGNCSPIYINHSNSKLVICFIFRWVRNNGLKPKMGRKRILSSPATRAAKEEEAGKAWQSGSRRKSEFSLKLRWWRQEEQRNRFHVPPSPSDATKRRYKTKVHGENDKRLLISIFVLIWSWLCNYCTSLTDIYALSLSLSTACLSSWPLTILLQCPICPTQH